MSKKKKSKKQNFSESQDREMHTVSSTEMTGAIPANPKQAYEDNSYQNVKK